MVQKLSLDEQIIRASQIIKEGGLASFPTETVYGIGANAYDPGAVGKIYKLKGRPAKNPLIIHISDIAQLKDIVTDINPDSNKLIKHFWPGPLTLIFGKSNLIPSIVTSGLDTVAVRMPDHPIARSLIQQAGVPVAAPSANPSGKPSSTHHRHVSDYFGDELFVIEGGACPIGVESTVINLGTDPPAILRQGGTPTEDIEKVLGKKLINASRNINTPQSPGMLYKHYSPKAKIVLIPFSNTMDELIIKAVINELKKGKMVGVFVAEEYSSNIPTHAEVIIAGSLKDLGSVSSKLFDSLIDFDKRGVDVIISQSFPTKGLGGAIMDRLKRASSGK